MEAFFGDVKKVALRELKGKCDRVIMPLPKGGESFLGEAFLSLKPAAGIIHFYQFEERKDPFSGPVEKVLAAAKKCGRKASIERKAVVRSFSPVKVQVVLDIAVE